MHTTHITNAIGKANIGISKSPITLYDVLSIVKRPHYISENQYEIYKKTMEKLFNNVLKLSRSDIIYEDDDVIFVDNITPNLLISMKKFIFIIRVESD